MWLSENTGEMDARSGCTEHVQAYVHFSPPPLPLMTRTSTRPPTPPPAPPPLPLLPPPPDPNAKVASWWDYGYQTTAMANRTVIVDNNTWNNTHIATVGRAMSSPERKAWQIFRSLDVEYVFVVFGGFIGYPSDDINKFLWMVRIGGGVFPEIKEPNYLGADGE